MCLDGHEVSPLAFLHSRKQAKAKVTFMSWNEKDSLETHTRAKLGNLSNERASVLEPGYSPPWLSQIGVIATVATTKPKGGGRK